MNSAILRKQAVRSQRQEEPAQRLASFLKRRTWQAILASPDLDRVMAAWWAETKANDNIGKSESQEPYAW